MDNVVYRILRTQSFMAIYIHLHPSQTDDLFIKDASAHRDSLLLLIEITYCCSSRLVGPYTCWLTDESVEEVEAERQHL